MRYPVQELENGVACVISVRPAGVACDGAMVQKGALVLFRKIALMIAGRGDLGGRILQALGQKELILRPLLIRREEYLDHLRRTDDWVDGGPVIRGDWDMSVVESKLPQGDDYFWMVEFSIPELFPANLRKAGEMIIRAGFDPDEDRAYLSHGPCDEDCALIASRVPGAFLFPRGKGHKTGDPAITGEDGAPVVLFDCDELASPLVSHTALFGAEPREKGD